MPSYSKHSVILVRYPFSDLSSAKVRTAVVISAPHSFQDILRSVCELTVLATMQTKL
jgi:mRNA interferase MazF